jgi:hypothetical protein
MEIYGPTLSNFVKTKVAAENAVIRAQLETHIANFTPTLDIIKGVTSSNIDTKEHLELVLKTGCKTVSESPSVLVFKTIKGIPVEDQLSIKVFLTHTELTLEKVFGSIKLSKICQPLSFTDDRFKLLPNLVDHYNLSVDVIPQLDMNLVHELTKIISSTVLLSGLPQVAGFVACLGVAPVLSSAISDYYFICSLGTQLFLENYVTIHFFKHEIFLDLYDCKRVEYLEYITLRDKTLLRYAQIKGLGFALGTICYCGSPEVYGYVIGSLKVFAQEEAKTIIQIMDRTLEYSTMAIMQHSSYASRAGYAIANSALKYFFKI